MLSLMIFALTAGFAFGLAQFRVAMLVPATVVLLILAAAFGLAAGATAWGTVGMAILIAAGLQVGYFAGLTKTLFRRNTRSRSQPSSFGVSRFG
ncbi:hypothetical protein ACSVBT_04930 [Afipia sp. TerB]